MTPPVTSTDGGSTSNSVLHSEPVADPPSIAKFRKFVSPKFERTERKQSRKALNYQAVRIQKVLFEKDENDKSEDSEDIEDDLLQPEPNLCSRVKKNDFVIAYIIFDFGTQKEYKKFYVGKLLKLGVGRKNSQIEADFLRRIPKLTDDDSLVGFSQSKLQDVWKIDADQILHNLKEPKFKRRGRYFFDISLIDEGISLQ